MLSWEDVCLVIDLEGFQIKKEFIVRELGWCDWEKQDYGSLHYRPPFPYQRLSLQDRRQVRYVRQCIHGLPYYPVQVTGSHDLKTEILELYQRVKTPDRTVVAYKGGCHEQKLLQALGLPHLNLETFRCPRFDDMARLDNIKSCVYHDDPQRHHCPQVECYHFVNWMNDRA